MPEDKPRPLGSPRRRAPRRGAQRTGGGGKPRPLGSPRRRAPRREEQRTGAGGRTGAGRAQRARRDRASSDRPGQGHGRERLLALEASFRAALAASPVRPHLDLTSRRAKEPLYAPPGETDLIQARIGFPGSPPFTRGIHPSMYRGRLWTMRQYSGMASPAETNRRFRYLLERGQTGLSVAFDLPTQLGMDPDEPLAHGEVGRVGVPVPTLDDLDRVFEGIPLQDVSVSMTINATAIILLAMLVALARRRGFDPTRLSGTVQNDILKEYIARGTYVYPLAPSLRLVTDTIEYAIRNLPRFNPISISGYHIREAGSTAVQELAFTFGDALAYVDACRARGLDPIRLGRRLSFFFNGQSDFLEEVAKFRAARRIWHRLLSERHAVTDPEALRLRFHTQTAGASLTAQDPMTNVVRVTLQALAAVLGGTQSLHTNALDEALGLPTEETARLALRTQQVIAHESGVADTVDPLGGSFAIESLTDTVEAEVLALLSTIERRGGMLKCIEDGWVGRQIQESAYVEQREVEEGRRIVVGVNAFRGPGDERTAVPGQTIDPSVEEGVRAGLREHRARRDPAPVASALGALGEGARGSDNLVEPIVTALEAGATLGEIAHTLRRVFGEHEADAGF